MRRAWLSVLAFVALSAGLGACSVDVEGATCKDVGTVDNCPSGQACGTDLKCSVKAAGCTPCNPASFAECLGGDVQSCKPAGDGVCSYWEVHPCGEGQTCQEVPASDATCVCDYWTVIPGVRPPVADCTQPSIKLAIDEAVKVPGTRVFLGGTAPATYGNELEDAAPIVVPAGVTVIGDETAPVAVPLNRIIEVRGSASAPNAVAALVVEQDASLRGLTVRRFDASAPAVGILLDGSSPAGGNSLTSVRVDVGGTSVPFGVGLRVAGGNATAGGNAVAVGDVVVQGATVAGLEVNRLDAGHVVLVTGSTFDQDHVGVSLLKGDLTLSGSTVKRSAWEGFVSATGTPGLTRFSIQDSLISWNGRGGVRMSVNDSVEFLRTRICGNTGYARSYSGVTRTVGGVLAVGNPPGTLAFRGNLVHDNGGDQVYVAASSTAWDLSGLSGCAANDRNVFANYTAPGVGVAAVGANVSALFNSWAQAFPAAGTDFFANPTSPVGSVDAGTGGGATDFCGVALPADLICPAP
jgi:hypothetical protein